MEQESFAEDFYVNAIPEDWKEFPIIQRLDGTYEITFNGLPYHCIPDMEDLFKAVDEYAKENPDKITVQEPEPEPTEEELRQREIEATIAEYRRNLQETDYIPLKLIEAYENEALYNELREEYAETLNNREIWRQYINDNE